MPFRHKFGWTASDKQIPLLPLHVSPKASCYRTAPGSPNFLLNSSLPGGMSSPAKLLPRSDALLNIARRESDLKTTVQELLNAQSEGLLAGLQGAPQERNASLAGSNLSSSNHASRIRSPKRPIPVRQPMKKKLGLQGARKGITKAMSDLADLKSEERQELNEEVGQRQAILSNIQESEAKSTGLRQSIRGIQSEDASQRVEDLRQQSQRLEQEIYTMETKLYEMKAQQRHILREIDGLDSSTQSKLSSYQSALSLAEKDIRRFLDRPPANNSASKSGLWALPKERRNLEMARDLYAGEERALKEQLQAVQAEESALEEGMGVWEEALQDVIKVEKALRGEMQQMSNSTSDSSQDRPTGRIQAILKTIQAARSQLESKLHRAESAQWQLLVCSIGAELEALMQGQEVLEAALDASGNIDTKAESQYTNGHHSKEDPIERGVTDRDNPLIETSGKPNLLDRSEDEDDGPGPELLISHHEDDLS